MHLKKPFLICNTKDNHLNVEIFSKHFHPSIVMQNFKDRYEVQVHLGNVDISEVLVYRQDESLKIYKKDKGCEKCNTLLSHFYIPSNVNTAAIKVKRSDYGICIIMPKVERTYSSGMLLLSIEE
jgi:hypothetical protein